jgi:hypothetical protein
LTAAKHAAPRILAEGLTDGQLRAHLGELNRRRACGRLGSEGRRCRQSKANGLQRKADAPRGRLGKKFHDQQGLANGVNTNGQEC